MKLLQNIVRCGKTEPRFFPLFFQVLACVLALGSRSAAQSLELRVEPGRAAHSFELLIDGVASTSSSFTSQLQIDGAGSYFRIEPGIEPRGFPESTFALRDITANEIASFQPDTNPDYAGTMIFSLAGSFAPSDGISRLYLCIPSELSNNGLIVVHPTLGLTTPST